MQENQTIARLLKKEKYSYEDLKTIVTLLRSENGCPWDREQDHHSIRPNLIEETYEVVEALDTEDPVLLREELGDLMFQIAFHAELEREAGRFELDDVVDEIAKKMITRHPHVFGDVKADSTAQVLQNWDAIKTEEKQRLTLEEKLRAIPGVLPSLMRAVKVCRKSGFAEKQTEEETMQKISQGVLSLEKAPAKEEAKALLGGILLNTACLCEQLGIDAEHALQDEIDSLIDKFAQKD